MNGDGKITREEFEALVKEIIEIIKEEGGKQ